MTAFCGVIEKTIIADRENIRRRAFRVRGRAIDSIRILFQKRNRGDFLTNTFSPLLPIVYRPRRIAICGYHSSVG